MKMKLSKALKVKNRLAGEVNRLQTLFARDNSAEQSRVNTNVANIELEMKEVVANLIEIKTKITQANIGIYEMLARKNEVASMKAFYERLNTRDGTFKERDYNAGQDIETVYVAFITRDKVDELSKAYQKEIDSLQDEIDEYNATTAIEVSFDI